MFNLKDSISFKLMVYNKNNKEISKIILSEEIDFNFHLPKETYYAEVIESILENGKVKNKMISRIYVGREENFGKLIEKYHNGKINLEISDSLFQNLDGIFKRSVLFEKKENYVNVKKILEDNEIVYRSLKETEKHIRRLTVALSSFYKKAESVKKLIRRDHE